MKVGRLAELQEFEPVTLSARSSQKQFVVNNIDELTSDESMLVGAAGWCIASFMFVGRAGGAALGGYFSGGLAAAGEFSFGVTLEQDFGEIIYN